MASWAWTLTITYFPHDRHCGSVWVEVPSFASRFVTQSIKDMSAWRSGLTRASNSYGSIKDILKGNGFFFFFKTECVAVENTLTLCVVWCPAMIHAKGWAALPTIVFTPSVQCQWSISRINSLTQEVSVLNVSAPFEFLTKHSYKRISQDQGIARWCSTCLTCGRPWVGSPASPPPVS